VAGFVRGVVQQAAPVGRIKTYYSAAENHAAALYVGILPPHLILDIATNKGFNFALSNSTNLPLYGITINQYWLFTC